MYTFKSVTWQVNGSVLPDGVGEGSRRGILFGVGEDGTGVERAEAHPLSRKIKPKVNVKIRCFIFSFLLP